MPFNRYSLANLVAIVTGAARGIGAAISQNLAEAGATVVIADLDQTTAETTRSVIEQAGGRALAVQADVAKRADIERLVQHSLEACGQIDILVNNAGITSIHPFMAIPDDEWERVMAVNAKGTFLCCQLVAPHMIARRSGRIINISSQAGITGQAYMAHYVASKFAVVGLTQSLALELGPHGITVNAVCPGDVATDMQVQVSQALSALQGITREALVAQSIQRCPLRRLETPQDVADAVLFLASGAAGFITGEALNVSGGLEFH
jgi:NAD(P)-dependent dehydrogenase (short-subunit alcohol dehydrogenase family)